MLYYFAPTMLLICFLYQFTVSNVNRYSKDQQVNICTILLGNLKSLEMAGPLTPSSMHKPISISCTYSPCRPYSVIHKDL